MYIRFVDDPIPLYATCKHGIFLAGPTPRDSSTSWRYKALDILSDLNYDHTVYIPERSDRMEHDWYRQVQWETGALHRATIIIFWIPRDLVSLPGFTTNDEWGYWKAKNPKKLLLGVPPNTPKTRYQLWWAEHLAIPTFNNLEDLLGEAVKRTNKEAGNDH